MKGLFMVNFRRTMCLADYIKKEKAPSDAGLSKILCK